MGNELSFEERKQVQLEMLVEIDAFCRKHNIKYALSCGTLIGAVRHKGFIPWDDDVDITMPYDDMLRFKQLFKSSSLKYIDIDTEPYYEFHFSRIVHLRTYRMSGKHMDYGICIDVYPIIECVSDERIQRILIQRAERKLHRRLFMIKWRRRIINRVPYVKTIPGYSFCVRDFYDFMTKDFIRVGSGMFYQLGGPIVGTNNNFYHNIWNFDPFEKLIEMQFESYSFFVPARFDDFLRVRYGEYMVLPPYEQRTPYHGGKYFWK